MFDTAAGASAGAVLPAVSEPPTVADLAALVTALAGVDGGGVSDAVRVDQLDVLERVKAACAAAQARVTAAFVDSQAEQAER